MGRDLAGEEDKAGGCAAIPGGATGFIVWVGRAGGLTGRRRSATGCGKSFGSAYAERRVQLRS